MKFAVISDIHLGLEKQNTDVPTDKEIESYLNEFVQDMNNNVHPQFVLNLGDLIEDHNKIDDARSIQKVIKIFNKLNCSTYYAAGNHDLKNISEEKLAKLFNQKDLYYSFDSNNYHFIVLYSKDLENKNIIIPNEQKEWLKKDLNKTKKQTIVFVHHGLANQDLTGNPWFDGTPERCLISNRAEIRNIFLESNKIISVFNGHAHWDKQDIADNISYFTIQSLSDTKEQEGTKSKTYAIVEIDDDKLTVKIKGTHPKIFLHKL
ncbi:MAG: metallophosphoesterase [Candidatus Woesearchaeota archaeon]